MTVSLSADDRFGIQDLLARYAWTIDTADIEGCVANFTADGALGDGQEPPPRP